jgi:hypothetical protein
VRLDVRPVRMAQPLYAPLDPARPALLPTRPPAAPQPP